MARVTFDYNKKIIEVTHFITCGNMKPLENGTVTISAEDKISGDIWDELSNTQREEVTWFFLDVTE